MSSDKTRYGDRVSQKKVVVVTTGHDRAKCYGGKVLGLTVVRPIFFYSHSKNDMEAELKIPRGSINALKVPGTNKEHCD